MVHSDFRTLYDVTGRINDINTVLVEREFLKYIESVMSKALESLQDRCGTFADERKENGVITLLQDLL